MSDTNYTTILDGDMLFNAKGEILPFGAASEGGGEMREACDMILRRMIEQLYTCVPLPPEPKEYGYVLNGETFRVIINGPENPVT